MTIGITICFDCREFLPIAEFYFVSLFVKGGRGGRRFVLTLAIGMVFGFLSACLLITATRDMPRMLNWLPGSAILTKDPHHYSEIEAEVNNAKFFFNTQKTGMSEFYSITLTITED